MAGIYPVFTTALTISQHVSKFPPNVTSAFLVLKLRAYSATAGFGFSAAYTALMGAIMAQTLSVGAFAREKRSKCADFLLTSQKQERFPLKAAVRPSDAGGIKHHFYRGCRGRL